MSILSYQVSVIILRIYEDFKLNWIYILTKKLALDFFIDSSFRVIGYQNFSNSSFF